LQELDQHLSCGEFRRIHRNALVNLHHIRKMSATTSQRWIVTLSNDIELVASKRLAHRVRRLLRSRAMD